MLTSTGILIFFKTLYIWTLKSIFKLSIHKLKKKRNIYSKEILIILFSCLLEIKLLIKYHTTLINNNYLHFNFNLINFNLEFKCLDNLYCFKNFLMVQ